MDYKKTEIINTENTFATHLSEKDARQIEYIYMQVWHEKGVVGGPGVWFETIVKFLISEGYDVKKKEDS